MDTPAERAEALIGQPIHFPVQWERGTLDSVLSGPMGEVLAYVIRRADGTIYTIDNQMRPMEGLKI